MQWPLDVLVHLVATGRKPAVSCAGIEQRAAGDVAEILPYLDGVRVNSMLDIGCGLALVDVLLARAVAPRRVYLLDSEATGVLDRGYKTAMKAWNSTAIAASMFHANVDVGVELVTLAPGSFELDEPVYLIISTRSWGHHYPVSMYLESVARSIAPGGVLAVDLRAGRGGAAEIQAAGFDQVAVIAQSSGKCDRVIFRRR
jgi:SAM-dependent methyltransferase